MFKSEVKKTIKMGVRAPKQGLLFTRVCKCQTKNDLFILTCKSVTCLCECQPGRDNIVHQDNAVFFELF